jgi:hypothetical protein
LVPFAVQTAQHWIPIHLNEDPHCDPDERKNGGPVEKQQEIMGLKRIRTHGKQHQEKSGYGGDDQILHLR